MQQIKHIQYSQPCQYSHKINTQVQTTKHRRLKLQGNSNFQANADV